MAYNDESNSEVGKFTDAQLHTLNTINIITDVALVLNLALATYILLRFIIPLKIKGVFIVQFYVVSVMLTIARICEVSSVIYDPHIDRWETKWAPLTFYRFSAMASIILFFAIGLLVTSTMFQIATSIQVMLGKHEPKKG